MNNEYTAFISYTHAPEDMAAAEKIQKSLERYHVPAPIRKKTGKNEIGRVFLDKEELGITTDLKEEIADALEKSQYLIVICSTATKASVWVEREIEYFLRNHSKRQILTVLVNGEPLEVIPEILLHDKTVHVMPDGTIFEDTVDYEPLSSDFRAGRKASRRAEITRLAAVLLNCEYAELAMREQHYRIKRLTAILSAAGILTAIAICYLLWSRARILENLNQAMINQSHFLSSESADLLEEGDRLRAIELAMEALPSQGNERPLVPQAENALVSALNAYNAPDTADELAMAETAEFSAKGEIQTMCKTKNDKYLLALDSYGIIYVWEIGTGSLIFELQSNRLADDDEETGIPEQKPTGNSFFDVVGELFESNSDGSDPETDLIKKDALRELQDNMEDLEELTLYMQENSWLQFEQSIGLTDGAGGILQMLLLSEETIAARSSDGVYVYNFLSGKEIWHFQDKANWHNVRMDADNDGKTIYLIDNESESDGLEPSPGTFTVTALDSGSGKILIEQSINASWNSSGSIHGSAVSENGSFLAFSVKPEQQEGEETGCEHIFLFNREQGTIREVEVGETIQSVLSFKYIDNDHCVIMGYTDYSGFDSDYLLSQMHVATFIEDLPLEMICIDSKNGEVMSRGSFSSPQINALPDHKGISCLHIGDETAIICMYANKAVFFSMKSGKKLDEIEFTDSIVEGVVRDGELVCCLKNGSIGTYRPEERGKEFENTYFPCENYGVLSLPRTDDAGKDRYFVASQPNTIRLYQAVYDEEFVRFDKADKPEDAFMSDCAIVGDYLVLFTNNSALYYLKLDGEGEGGIQKMVLSEEESEFDYIGSDPENEIIWLKEKTYNSEKNVFCISLSDGTITPFTFENGAYTTYHMQRGSRLSYMSREKVTLLDTADLSSEVPKAVFTVPVGNVSKKFFISPVGKQVVTSRKDVSAKNGYSGFVTDVSTGEQIMLPVDLQYLVRLADWNSVENRFAITDGINVYLFESNGNLICKMHEAGKKVVNFTFFKDELIIRYSGGNLTRYEALSGKLLGRTAVREYTDETFIENTEWIFSEDTLFLTCRGLLCSFMSLVDTKTWEESASMQFFYGYDSKRDRIICGGQDRVSGIFRIGYYPHYSVDQLLQKGSEALNGFSMTDEERAAYGLKAKPGISYDQ